MGVFAVRETKMATDRKEVCMRVVGGSADATASLGPRLGPLGLSAKKVGVDIAKATKKYTGMKVTIKLIVENRNAKVEVVPTASTLLSNPSKNQLVIVRKKRLVLLVVKRRELLMLRPEVRRRLPVLILVNLLLVCTVTTETPLWLTSSLLPAP